MKRLSLSAHIWWIPITQVSVLTFSPHNSPAHHSGSALSEPARIWAETESLLKVLYKKRFCRDICRVNLSHTTHFTSIFKPNNKTFLWIDKGGYAWNFLTKNVNKLWVDINFRMFHKMFMVSRLNQQEVNHPYLTPNMLLKLHTDCLFYDKKVFWHSLSFVTCRVF